MKIENYLKQLSEKFNPDHIQRERIKERIFKELNLTAPKSSKFNLIDFLNMNKKLIIGTASLALLTIFFGVPLLLNSALITNTSQPLTLPNTDNPEINYPEMKNEQGYSGLIEEPNTLETERSQDLINISRNPSEDTETEESNRAKQKSATLSLQVENINGTIDLIYELVSSIEGYVVSSNYSVNESSGNGSITIRVPSEKFDFAIKELRNMSIEVLFEQTNIIDLQNEITDANNDLTELRKELEDKYGELETAPESGKKAIQDEINRLENRIKIVENDLQNLSQKASYSTIEISLSKKGEQVNSTEDLGDVIERAWEMAKEILFFWSRVGVWVIVVLPAALLPGVVVVAVMRAGKVIREKVKK